MGTRLNQEQADALTSYIDSLPEEKRGSFISGFQSLPDTGKMGLTTELVTKFGANKQSQARPISNNESRITSLISDRGDLWSDIGRDFQSQNPLRKGLGAIKTAGAPFNLIESGIANPLLDIQAGKLNPINLAKQSALGFSGMKQGQYGDIGRVAGYPEPVAASMGFILNASPVKVLDTANKTFGKISRFTDKGIMSAGENLVSATDKAMKFVGSKLDSAYAPVNNIKVNSDEFINEMSKLPPILVKKIEQTFGGGTLSIEDIAQNLNVGYLRNIKQIIGKYRPNVFGQTERGLQENIDAESINSVYGAVKKLLNSTVVKNVGEKSGKLILEADEHFSDVARASNYIKNKVTDSILRKSTKAGEIAKKLVLEGDVSGREALNVIKSSGNSARDSINKAVRALENFNRVQSISRVAKHGLSAAIYGGAIGAIGGTAASRFIRRDND